VKGGRALELLAKVGRGVEQNPRRSIAANRERGLRTRFEAGGASADCHAVMAVAIPLRETAAST